MVGREAHGASRGAWLVADRARWACEALRVEVVRRAVEFLVHVGPRRAVWKRNQKLQLKRELLEQFLAQNREANDIALFRCSVRALPASPVGAGDIY